MRLVIRFPESRMQTMPLAILHAKAGDYRRRDLSGLTLHEARFLLPATVAMIHHAIALLLMVRSKRGTEILTDGTKSNGYHLVKMLDCYLASLQVKDLRAHCWVQNGNNVYPCRLAFPYGLPSTHHPSSRREQIETLLRNRSCLCCPSLRLDEWELDYGA